MRGGRGGGRGGYGGRGGNHGGGGGGYGGPQGGYGGYGVSFSLFLLIYNHKIPSKNCPVVEYFWCFTLQNALLLSGLCIMQTCTISQNLLFGPAPPKREGSYVTSSVSLSVPPSSHTSHH